MIGARTVPPATAKGGIFTTGTEGWTTTDQTAIHDRTDNNQRQDGANVVIDPGEGDVLTLRGVQIADLDAADFNP